MTAVQSPNTQPPMEYTSNFTPTNLNSTGRQEEHFIFLSDDTQPRIPEIQPQIPGIRPQIPDLSEDIVKNLEFIPEITDRYTYDKRILVEAKNVWGQKFFLWSKFQEFLNTLDFGGEFEEFTNQHLR